MCSWEIVKRAKAAGGGLLATAIGAWRARWPTRLQGGTPHPLASTFLAS
jgi:hypothetical protein